MVQSSGDRTPTNVSYKINSQTLGHVWVEFVVGSLPYPLERDHLPQGHHIKYLKVPDIKMRASRRDQYMYLPHSVWYVCYKIIKYYLLYTYHSTIRGSFSADVRSL